MWGAPSKPSIVADDELILVLTTEATLEKAEQLAKALLAKRLVACVSLLPIVSHYSWQDALTRSEEVQLLLKTQAACLNVLYPTLMALHSYETPEWITLVGQTRGAYGAWCAQQLITGPLREGGAPPARAMTPKDEDPAG